jgi:hypothetical protein
MGAPFHKNKVLSIQPKDHISGNVTCSDTLNGQFHTENIMVNTVIYRTGIPPPKKENTVVCMSFYLIIASLRAKILRSVLYAFS